jgi:flagellar hook-associated protein 1 FlgK
MSTLNGIMQIAVGALQVAEGALNVTSNNIANSNTPGYSREVVNLSASAPITEGNLTVGTGVQIDSFQSIRDQILQLGIYDQTQQQSSAQARVAPTQQIQTFFSNPQTGIGADIQAFFNSVNQLSTNPSDTTARQNVLTAANNLVNDFHAASQQISTVQTGLNSSVTQSVSEINSLTSQIAQLNGQIVQKQQLGEDPGSLQDTRDQLITQLSQQVQVKVVPSNHGDSLTLSNGTTLVSGNQSFALSSSTNASGNATVLSNGVDITSSIQGGTLGGVLQVRDQSIPSLQSSLDTLASQFGTAINTANQAGYDLNGNPGQALFSNLGVPGAASNISVTITDPTQIAASSDGTVGSNGNVANLLAVQSNNLPSGATPSGAYASFTATIGNLNATAQAQATASGTSLQSLLDQRSSVSGVSINEETTNMIQYQQQFQAAARVVSTVDQLAQTLVYMGLGG